MSNQLNVGYRIGGGAPQLCAIQIHVYFTLLLYRPTTGKYMDNQGCHSVVTFKFKDFSRTSLNHYLYVPGPTGPKLMQYNKGKGKWIYIVPLL